MLPTFATRMTEAVAASKLTGRRLAVLAKTSPGQVSQWLNGQVNPDNIKADVLERISEALGVRPRWLLYGEPPMRDGGPAVKEVSAEYNVTETTASKAWRAYAAAPEATRAAIDVLLKTATQRNDICRDFPHLATGISLIEQWAQAALTARKSA